MSPETELQHVDVLGESARIAAALLSVEAWVAEGTSAERAAKLNGIREHLGYTAVTLMQTDAMVDTRIANKTPVIPPEGLVSVLPLTQASAETTETSRQAIGDILTHRDGRLVAIVGPCSIHDPAVALEYAHRVKNWREQFSDDLEVVMRFYPEKPRTERGWKGFVYDPRLDGSDDINLGLVGTRLLASQITALGVPLAMERLNALTPQYVNGLIAYDAIGARNVTDQKAREYASGTSSPVGFKNTPEGDVTAAAQAVISARGPHSFLGIDMNGTPSQVTTNGNELAHIILRGGGYPNYQEWHIKHIKCELQNMGLKPTLIVDASHGNSRKQAARQIEVVEDVSRQLSAGETAIHGMMIESNLVAGKQSLEIEGNGFRPVSELRYGQSITDECVDLATTEAMLTLLQGAAQERRQHLTAPV